MSIYRYETPIHGRMRGAARIVLFGFAVLAAVIALCGCAPRAHAAQAGIASGAGGTAVHDHANTSNGGALGNVQAQSVRVVGETGVVVASGPFTVGGSTFTVAGGSVGVRSSPGGVALTVNGDAQFGAGATKSTFTATGNLDMDASAQVLMGWRRGTVQASIGASSQANLDANCNQTGEKLVGAIVGINVEDGVGVPDGNVWCGPNPTSLSDTFLRTICRNHNSVSRQFNLYFWCARIAN